MTGTPDSAAELYALVCAAVPQLEGLLGLAPGDCASWDDVNTAVATSDIAGVIADRGLPMSTGQGTLVAALLARSGNEHLAHIARPNFWRAISALDPDNARLVLRILADGRWSAD